MINIRFRCCDFLYMAKFTVYYFLYCDCNHGVTYRRAHVMWCKVGVNSKEVSCLLECICVAFGDLNIQLSRSEGWDPKHQFNPAPRHKIL